MNKPVTKYFYLQYAVLQSSNLNVNNNLLNFLKTVKKKYNIYVYFLVTSLSLFLKRLLVLKHLLNAMLRY